MNAGARGLGAAAVLAALAAARPRRPRAARDRGHRASRAFANTVSLGPYAEALRRTGYRRARVRTLLDVVSDVLGPEGEGLRLCWQEPDGRASGTCAAMPVSDNAYRLGLAVGAGTRPRLDAGALGVTVFGGPWPGDPADRAWRAASSAVRGEPPVSPGIDGETALLASPLQFRGRPRARRVRIARAHPGASPSALQPRSVRDVVDALAAIAPGRASRRRAPGAPT